MFLPVVLLFSLVALSAAHPVSVRQLPPCGNVTVSTACATALSNYLQAETTLLTDASSGTLTTQLASQIENTFQTNLDVFCTDNCKNMLSEYYDCVGSDVGNNVTEQILCARNLADGTFCPVKVVQQLPTGGGLIPTCTSVNAASCTTACHETFNTLKNNLGCCADNLYGLSFGSFSSYQSNFTACGAMLDSPCYLGSSSTSATTSAAADVYVNLMLVTVLVIFTAMV